MYTCVSVANRDNIRIALVIVEYGSNQRSKKKQHSKTNVLKHFEGPVEKNRQQNKCRLLPSNITICLYQFLSFFLSTRCKETRFRKSHPNRDVGACFIGCGLGVNHHHQTVEHHNLIQAYWSKHHSRLHIESGFWNNFWIEISCILNQVQCQFTQ